MIQNSGLEVSIKDGRYGLFVQLGIGSNPKRVTLPPNWGFENVDLETAINFLALPREVGTHPDTGSPHPCWYWSIRPICITQ